ncbi:MAG: sortase [Solirubrobacteraceae bacterium]|jgi:sortase A|nr:sortase [Solirubrobacteraceae bacterium]
MTATAPVPRRSRLRRALRTFSSVLIVVGALLLIDAVLTLVWQEPLSALYAHARQGHLQGQLKALDRRPLAPVERKAIDALPDTGRRLAFAARAFARTVAPGDALGRLRIPRIRLSIVMVAGTDAAQLREGPGHYPATPLPGRHGTVAVAGHRTTYLAPFRNIDALKPGDEIEVTMPYGRFSYRVDRTRIVAPTALWVTRPVGHDQIVLTACNPLYSAAQRIVVFARLDRATPRGWTAR